ncbi:MAG: hypothetical protein AB1589_22365 [Cyanobacteriota bacterium]
MPPTIVVGELAVAWAISCILFCNLNQNPESCAKNSSYGMSHFAIALSRSEIDSV